MIGSLLLARLYEETSWSDLTAVFLVISGKSYSVDSNLYIPH